MYIYMYYLIKYLHTTCVDAVDTILWKIESNFVTSFFCKGTAMGTPVE